MLWKDVPRQYDDTWLVIEVINAKSRKGRRLVHEVSIVDSEKESRSAYKKYQNLHRVNPNKEMYVVYSGWNELAFEERMWMGTRGRI
jgi:hypothetical protein